MLTSPRTSSFQFPVPITLPSRGSPPIVPPFPRTNDDAPGRPTAIQFPSFYQRIRPRTQESHRRSPGPRTLFIKSSINRPIRLPSHASQVTFRLLLLFVSCYSTYGLRTTPILPSSQPRSLESTLCRAIIGIPHCNSLIRESYPGQGSP